jgi:NADH-quinone oxidoreductase subunit G
MNTITIFIDNKPYRVKEDQNLLQACLSLGFDIPYFCWHPAMHSVGACRQCAVKEFKDEKDTRGRIVMSCMTPVREGQRISIDDADARSFRKSIIELLMLNHPHDCPVCDEGGECHLQDMTVMTGHAYRRTRFKKRTYGNQYLGPFVAHEMNRCIQCYRCVRFYRDYAGGRDLDVFAAHDYVYFGRQKEGVLESEFSGNLAEVCPTGVFTDKNFQKQYTRKWDLQTAPSLCVHCGVGCNTIPGERYGELRRIRNRYNGQVNGYFLCDRGRYGFEFVNSKQRVLEPLIKTEPVTGQHRLSPAEALARIKNILSGSKGVIGIGSPRASLESNFALRTLVGPENFYTGMSDREKDLVFLIVDVLRKGPARSPSLRDVESCDAVFVLGEDVTNTAPMLALALCQASRRKAFDIAAGMRIPRWDDAAVRTATQGVKGAFSLAAPYPTKLDETASHVYHASPDDIARLGFAVAHELNKQLPEVKGVSDRDKALALSIAGDLQIAKRPLIVSGIGCASEAVIQAAANIAWALSTPERTAHLAFAVPECNSLGLGIMGGGSLKEAFELVREEKADTAVILENDLYRRAATDTVDGFITQLKHLIVIDHLMTPTAESAEVLLPAGTFAEADGTLVNCEGRAQRFYQVFVPHTPVQESWRWLRDIITARDVQAERQWEGFDDIVTSLAAGLPELSAVSDVAPPAGFRIAGMKIARQPHRYSGRTAMFADKTVFEPKPPHDRDSPLAFSMEGYPGQPPAALIPRFWAPGWNSPQAVTKFQSEAGGPLRDGDPGRRVFEPSAGRSPSFFTKVPDLFAVRKDSWLFIPSLHIFGSEEMSMHSPAIRERSPGKYVGLNLEQAPSIKLRESDAVLITIAGISFTAPVKHIHGLPEGVAALSPGFTGIQPVLPLRGTIAPAKRQGET